VLLLPAPRLLCRCNATGVTFATSSEVLPMTRVVNVCTLAAAVMVRSASGVSALAILESSTLVRNSPAGECSKA
jgi:hypothetical protein